MVLKPLKIRPPLHVWLNNSIARPSFKNLRDNFLTKWSRMPKVCYGFVQCYTLELCDEQILLTILLLALQAEVRETLPQQNKSLLSVVGAPYYKHCTDSVRKVTSQCCWGWFWGLWCLYQQWGISHWLGSGLGLDSNPSPSRATIVNILQLGSEIPSLH